MQAAVKYNVVVQEGGKVEVSSPELRPGEIVEVIVLSEDAKAPKHRSAMEILSGAPGHRLFRTAEEVDSYINEERSSWDR